MTRKLVTVKVEMEDYEKIELFCINQKVTISELIRKALKEYLEKYGIKIKGT